jgi:hypothetical protein
MQSSTVARLDDVPASGRRLKATFPSGQLTSFVKVGDGIIGIVDVSAATEAEGSIAVDARIAIFLRALRLPEIISSFSEVIILSSS